MELWELVLNPFLETRYQCRVRRSAILCDESSAQITRLLTLPYAPVTMVTKALAAFEPVGQSETSHTRLQPSLNHRAWM
jgi:hypothetical protein